MFEKVKGEERKLAQQEQRLNVEVVKDLHMLYLNKII